MTLPIIFIREQRPESGFRGLPFSIQTAKRWNPNGRVVLIGDAHQPKEMCEFYPIEDYSENKAWLRAAFKAKDPKNDWFLFVTLWQWFAIAEWMGEHNVQRACCFDCDILCFCDVEKETSKLGDWDLSLSCPMGTCQAPTLLTLQAVEGFCRFVACLYGHKDGSDWQNILSVEQDSMSLWSHYVRLCNPNPKIVDTSKVLDCVTWCHNFGMDYHGYEWDGTGKVIHWSNGQPWIKQNLESGKSQFVRFNTIHMWSSFKSRMAEFCAASEASM